MSTASECGYGIGIDIGSTCAKAVVMDGRGELVYRLVQPTGWSSVDTAAAIARQLEEAGYPAERWPVVATGYGRVCVPYAGRQMTEITCHAKGACRLHGAGDLTVIDIGGQDTKIILAEGGAVKDFIMNDKCSAGTGRFLEVMASTLGVSPEELCRMAPLGDGSAKISSMCTVFAETEVISLIGRGERRENIAFAVVDSIVEKVLSQASRLTLGGQACLTGGLCEFDYLRGRLSEALKRPVLACADGRYAGAVGAALEALRAAGKGAAE